MARNPRRRTSLTVPALLDRLEELYGRAEPGWPVAPYDFIVWWNCGYPASDAACAKGWQKLQGRGRPRAQGPPGCAAARPGRGAQGGRPGSAGARRAPPGDRPARPGRIRRRPVRGSWPRRQAAKHPEARFPPSRTPGPTGSSLLPGSSPWPQFRPMARRSWFGSSTERRRRTTAPTAARPSGRSRKLRPGDLRGADAGLPPAQASRPGNLQAHHAQVPRVRREAGVCLFPSRARGRGLTVGDPGIRPVLAGAHPPRGGRRIHPGLTLAD